MEPYRELGKALLVLGIILAGIGLFFISGAKLPFRLGKLPGDVVFHGRSGTIYFPIVTCIVLSVIVTLILWLASAFRR